MSPSFGYDVCDGDGCGVRSNLHPFPHRSGCKYGTGDPVRDMEIAWAVRDAADPLLPPEQRYPFPSSPGA